MKTILLTISLFAASSAHALMTPPDEISKPQGWGARPDHKFNEVAQPVAGPVRLRYSLDAVAGTTTDTAGRIVLPARFLHGAGASLEVPHAEGLTLGVQVDNLFDLRTLHVRSSLGSAPIPVPVSDFLDFPLPGRTVWVTARFAYEAAPAGEITR